MKFGSRALAATCLALALSSALAQTFPSKPIRVLVGLPGGATDATVRFAAVEMSKHLGQPVVVEIMGGANGTIAANVVVNARPDGYTLYFGSTAAISPLFNKNNGIDATKTMAPISNFAIAPYIFYVNSKLPVHSVRDLVAWSKANPGKLNMGSGAVNAAILFSVLSARSGLEYENIPFKGSGLLVAALLNGDIGVAATISSGNFTPHVRAGTIRPLFVTTERRFPLMPDVPTATELGIPDFVALTVLGLWAPIGTPKDIVQKLSAASAAAVKTPDVDEKLRSEPIGVQPDGSTPEELLRAYTKDLNFWREAARISKYRPE
jgi:tripartite-type tricarboxylate transporter receptor subunit TctC